MVHAEFFDDAIYSISLSKRSHFTSLLIKENHQKRFHSGVLSHVSSTKKWTLDSSGTIWSREIRSIHGYGVCKRFQGGQTSINVSVAQEGRRKICSPHLFDPLYIQLGWKFKGKVWAYRFTCVTVKAIHLELIKDITAEQFLLTLRRFIARRGKPTQLILDNAPQFKLAKNCYW